MAVTLKMTPGGIPLPPAFVQPSGATLGSIKASKVAWDGASVTADFTLPADAAVGPQDVTVTFPGPPGVGQVRFTGKAAFTIR